MVLCVDVIYGFNQILQLATVSLNCNRHRILRRSMIRQKVADMIADPIVFKDRLGSINCDYKNEI